MRRLILLAIVAVLPFSGCTCQDEIVSGWELHDDIGWPQDAVGDVGPDVVDAWDAPPDAMPDVGPDVADAADTRDAADVPRWEPEEVPVEYALTDRTSLAVDPEGTLWLGYHSCVNAGCFRPKLRVIHKPIGGEWSGEEIRRHEGIFGVRVINPGEPIVAFPDSVDETVYKVAMRSADGQWRLQNFPVDRSDRPSGDGFDVAQDGQKFFVSFAPYGASQVDLYTYDTTRADARWERQSPLRVSNPQAAMERGLQTDNGESAYLVNQAGLYGTYGVYRYDEELDRWPQSVELQEYQEVFVHSLVITDDFELCMSGNYNADRNYEQGHLLVTCGSMFDLTQEIKYFADQHLASRHPSSIIEGDDGTLYVAFNPYENDELRVASRDPQTHEWTVETVFDGPSYGVSTAIDHSGDLVISFYTCDNASECSLKVVWETPE